MLCQQRGSGHDLAGLAVAALRNVDFLPGNLQRMCAVRREPFNGRYLGIRGGRDRRQAGADGLSAQMHGAGAALANPASILRAREVQHIPKHPQEWGIGRYVDGL